MRCERTIQLCNERFWHPRLRFLSLREAGRRDDCGDEEHDETKESTGVHMPPDIANRTPSEFRRFLTRSRLLVSVRRHRERRAPPNSAWIGVRISVAFVKEVCTLAQP